VELDVVGSMDCCGSCCPPYKSGCAVENPSLLVGVRYVAVNPTVGELHGQMEAVLTGGPVTLGPAEMVNSELRISSWIT